MNTGRRTFLKGVGGGAAAALAIGGESAQAAAARPLAASRKILELEREIVGALPSAEGGGASAELATFVDAGLVERKDVVGIHYEPIVLQAGLGFAPEFYNWVSGFFTPDFKMQSGAVVSANFNYKEVARREFTNALITEVSFPTLDGSKKEPAYMEVKIQPESTQFKMGGGGTVTPPPLGKAKTWLSSNFRFELDGLEDATKKVSKVEGFTVKLVGLPTGEAAPQFTLEVYPQVPNIVITIPATDLEPFLDWFDAFVIEGNSGPEQEKTGSIICLAPNQKDELLRINLAHVGIVSIGESSAQGAKDSINRFEVELYVEEMKLLIKGGGGGGL